MLARKRIAVPSMQPGGLEAQRSGHFGRCDVFTLIDLEDDKVLKVEMVPNVDRADGGCLVPVQLLAGQGVHSIVVSGMGMRPLLGFMDVGIEVLLGEGITVNDALKSYIAGNLEQMKEQNVCGGH